MKGVGRYTWHLIDALSRKVGDGVTLNVVVFGSELPEFESANRIRWIRFGYQSELKLGLSIIHRLVNELRPAALVRPADKIGRKYGCPTLTVCHDLNPLIWNAGGHRALHRKIVDSCWEYWRGYAMRHSDVVVCNSEFIRKAAIEHFRIDPQKTTLGYCGVDARLPQLASVADANSLRSLYGQEGFVLAFATGDPREGAEVLPSLFKSAVQSGYPGNLVLAGVKRDSLDAQQLITELQASGLEGRYHILPFLGEAELPLLAGLYGTADFYLETSRHEGFGMQLVEAIACGTTCFSSGKGALEEVGGGFPLNLEIESPVIAGKSIADAWKRGEHNRDNALQVAHALRFDWSGAKNAVCEFVERCLG